MLNGLYAINGELRSQLSAQLNAARPTGPGVIDNSPAVAADAIGGQTKATKEKPTASHSSGSIADPGASASASRSNNVNDADVEQPGGWTEVVSSKSKKRRIQTSGQGVGATVTADTDNGEIRQKKNKSRSIGSKSNRVMVGTKKLDWPVVGTVDQSKVAAAKPYLRKSVFCVDNVRTDVTVKDLETFVASSLYVNVVSCFQVKPRRAKWQKDAGIVPNDRNTFRLCIDREDEQNFLNE